MLPLAGFGMLLYCLWRGGNPIGVALLERMRALPPERGGNTPVVALTAYARVEDRLRVLESGFAMHVVKPVDPAELIGVVASVVRRAVGEEPDPPVSA
jgi:CheY-like chemotaxis protein